MDERVIRSMARWPDVPVVFGWLALDGRGRWLLRGETIANRTAVAFISRNYTHDETGRWNFQNGPQRVFVDLPFAPWVLRFSSGGTLSNHVGAYVTSVNAVVMDETGAVLLDTPQGLGYLDDRDLEAFSDCLCGADGIEIDDDSVETRLDMLLDGGEGELAVRICGELMPVGFLRTTCVPSRFRFIREPREE